LGSLSTVKVGVYMRKKKILGLSLLLILLIISGLLIYRELRVSNRAIIRVVGINVYWDPNCTTPAKEIDWGEVEPGINYSREVFFKNLGNTNLSLTLQVTDWDPPYASNYFLASWTYQGEILSPGECLPVNFTLSCIYDPETMELINFTDFTFVYLVQAQKAIE